MTDEENRKKIEAIEKAMGMFGSKSKEPVEKKAKKAEIAKEEVSFPDKNAEEVKEKIKEEIILETKAEEQEEEEVSLPKKENKSSKSFPLEKLKENLKPEVKEALRKVAESVSKETVSKFVDYMEANKDQVFDKSVTDVFDNLSPAEASILSKKMAEWEIPQEASEINASVIIAWLNKTKK